MNGSRPDVPSFDTFCECKPSSTAFSNEYRLLYCKCHLPNPPPCIGVVIACSVALQTKSPRPFTVFRSFRRPTSTPLIPFSSPAPPRRSHQPAGMSATTPPMKTVRFALDDDEPRTPTPTPKKTVRFALENDVVVEAPTSSLDGAVEASTATLNADPTLSTASQTSSSGTNNQSTCSTLSPIEIRTWSEEVSSRVPLEETPTTFSPETPTLHRSYSDDEGEKDAAGRVVEASHEPCEKCGGKVVWATMGEWLMICGECQEPQ
ncbi:hypothetical protein HBH98_100200 [Parastagonospora nodorum]|nr:hypothetical protein HBH98_100200 [Parastagonospora nodorum]KAH4382278.1 hypothetical protein HBH97_083310 [Parastagonospora nodorum]KAH4398463.1 hypothetical protein HBH99_113130 [Parastagonospora nodorum]KAH4898359.1 hypothetical protein HBI80_183150 [Parastagonospora nodorum]KAH4929485.1 hypothetical protein HBI79_121110 [Parastagonospora nodorum]